jgi:hypothetical protein
MLLAGLLFGHAYSARILACSSPHSALQKITGLDEVFRIALGPDAAFAMVSLRAEARLARVDLGERADVDVSDPLPGPTEELVRAGDRFYGTSLTSADEETDPGVEEPKNLLLTLDGEGTLVDTHSIPGMCWINCMHWSEPERRLYLGCEERAGLYRYDPASREVVDSQFDPALGDVQKIAFDPDADRFFTVSLWKKPTLTEVRRSDLEVLRQARIGGMHYDLAYDSGAQRLFATAYYASRVRVVEADSMELRSTLSTGLGTRAVAVHEGLRLLLASSIYDGILRVWNIDDERLLVALPVGGYVKHIVVDEAREHAYFSSRCGLYRLDLGAL